LARKILLADDSVTAQNMGRKILADAGYEVIAVNNGSAALKKIAELKPELVILDVYMPGYSGLEVCQRLKESQETSRIPVLLSVGKLEPFKPEEAQRVRADGYIVKPFEASELLSALSKLEDKVVPRSEPSKPGRFARAIASAEESARGRSQNTSEQNGWKSRIGFPHEKSDVAEKPADDFAIYNPMNRDLRTVVETAGEKATEAASRKQQAETRANVQPSEAADSSVDVGALAPTGLPQDVTPEEVAAITAAAAQLQMANAAVREQSQIEEPEARAENVAIAEDASAESAPAGLAETSAAFYPADQPRNENEHQSEHQPEHQDDEPVSMAVTADSVAAAAGSSRWTAVPVALEADEASLSLEREMHKAYAAFVASEAENAAPVNSSVAVEEVPPGSVAIVNREPQMESVPEAAAGITLTSDSAPAVIEQAAIAQSEVTISHTNFESTPQALTTADSEKRSELSPSESFGTSASESNEVAQPDPVRVAEFMSPVSETDVAGLAGLVGLSAELQQPMAEPACEPEEALAASHAFAPTPRSENVVDESPADESPAAAESEAVAGPQPESEVVKSTAAAWASWRQIRDINTDTQAPPPSKEFDSPQPLAAETSARAVAAGAEAAGTDQPLPETVAITTNGDTQDVASIVDSVLADLRPKLMAEISRKMAEKK
jgi:two-component system chemotaxis response regulator CheY